MKGWIVIDRKRLSWKWHDNPFMVALLDYLLLSANYEATEWHDIVVERGQLVTSRDELVKATGISERRIRTCLKRMEKDGTLTIKATNKFSLVTICKYDDYQFLKDSDRPADRPTTDQQMSTSKQINNNIINTSPRAYMCEDARKSLSVVTSWAEQVTMKCGYRPEDYPIKVAEFLGEMDCQCKVWDDENDMRAHFYNWLKLQAQEKNRAKSQAKTNEPKFIATPQQASNREQELQRSQSLSDSFKQNNERKFVGDVRDLCPSLFKSGMIK